MLGRAQIDKLEKKAFAHLIARALQIGAETMRVEQEDVLAAFEVPDMNTLLADQRNRTGFLTVWEREIAGRTMESKYVDENDRGIQVVGTIEDGKLRTMIYIYEVTDGDDDEQ